MKYTIESIKKCDVVIDIEFPHYRKGICHYYKIISEDVVIQVCTLSGHENIGFSRLSLAFSSCEEECTESEYKKVLNKVLKTLEVW